MTAWTELNEYMDDGEVLKSIVFGEYGGGGWPQAGEGSKIPLDKQGVVLDPDEAKPLMQNWEADGGFGVPECHALYAWTNRRVVWITQYDGATGFNSAPRNPIKCKPKMPGG